MKPTFLVLLVAIYSLVISEGLKYPSTVQLIANLGFVAESHQVLTKDGFILSLIRILAPSSCRSKRVVTFLHGQGAAPRVFIANSKGNNHSNPDICAQKIDRLNVGNSLPLDLAQRCYSVWLLTFRGTEHGSKHIKYKISDKRFWDYSFDEVLKFDLPAQLDYIRKAEQTEKVTFIGHSIGGPLGLLLATNPKYEHMFDSAILLGPTTPVTPKSKRANSITKLNYSLAKLLRYINGPLLRQPLFLNFLLKICDKPIAKLVVDLMQRSYGYDIEQFDLTRACDYAYHQQMSIKSLSHMFQMTQSPDGKFHKFDFGLLKNLQLYGRPQPPEYNLSSITLKKIAIFYGVNDKMVSWSVVPNWNALLKVKLLRLSPVKHNKFNHIDFLLAKDVGKILNWEILETLQEIHCGKTL